MHFLSKKCKKTLKNGKKVQKNADFLFFLIVDFFLFAYFSEYKRLGSVKSSPICVFYVCEVSL